MRARDFDEDRMPGTLIDLGNTHAFSPDPLPPALEISVTDDSYQAALRAMYAIGRLREIGERVDNPRMIQLPFIYREAVDSSEIEGTRVTLPDLYTYEAQDDGDDRHQLLESDTESLQEVTNYVSALETGITALEERTELSLESIKRLHEILLGTGDVRSYDPNPGEFRDDYVNIGGGRFVPTPPSNVPAQMQTLEQYIQTGSQYDDLIDIALVHYQLETIHPFIDGNGRVGRLVIALMLYDRGLLPAPYLHLSEFIKRRKGEYTDRLLAVSQHGAWEQWIEFFLDGLATQAANTCARATDLVDLRETYRRRYRDGPPSVRSLAMELFTNPVVTAPAVADILDCSYPTANNAIERLESDDVLDEVTGNERNRTYHATELLEIVDAPPQVLEPEWEVGRRESTSR